MYAQSYAEYVNAGGVVVFTRENNANTFERLRESFDICEKEIRRPEMPDFVDCDYVKPPQHTPYHQNYNFYIGDVRRRYQETFRRLHEQIKVRPNDVVIHYRKYEYGSEKYRYVPKTYFENIVRDLRQRRGYRHGVSKRQDDIKVYYITEPELHERDDPFLRFFRNELGALPYRGKNEIEDMIFATRAGTIVLTQGTFSWMIGFLSNLTYQKIHVPFRSSRQSTEWYPSARLFVHDDPRYVYHDLDNPEYNIQTASEVLKTNSYFSRAVRRRPRRVPWLLQQSDENEEQKESFTDTCDVSSSTTKVILNQDSRLGVLNSKVECVPHAIREFCYDSFKAHMVSHCTRSITKSLMSSYDLAQFRDFQLGQERDQRAKYIRYLTSLQTRSRGIEWHDEKNPHNMNIVPKSLISHDCGKTLPEISSSLHIHEIVRSSLYPFGSVMTSQRCPLSPLAAPCENQNEEEDYVVIAWYTSNREDKALRLLRSCERFGIPCMLYEIKKPFVISLNQHENVTLPSSNLVNLKPWFLLHAMRVLQPGRDFLYVDIDMVFESRPEFTVPENLDMMLYDFNQEYSKPNLPYHIVAPSSVLYLRPTSRTQSFVSEWASSTIYNPFAPDDHLLDHVMEFSTCDWRSILHIETLSKAHTRYRTLNHFDDADEVIIDHPDGLHEHNTQVNDMFIPVWSDDVVGFVRIWSNDNGL